MSEHTYPCRCGPGYGMVITTPENEPMYARPCADCNPKAYARWANGEFRPTAPHVRRDPKAVGSVAERAVDELASRRKDLL